MTSEWDGTPWEGRAAVVAKAATGTGVGFYTNALPMTSYDQTPQKLMKRAQIAYHTNPWVGTAEAVVTRKVVGLPWHLEDGEDEEYGDDAPPDVKTVIDLIERPQLILGNLQPSTATRRLMWSLTSRHLGLCGMTHWYGDRMDQFGIPEAWLYVNPARMWAEQDSSNNLTGWMLDATSEDGYGNPQGGLHFELSEILTFYLDPPDHGHYGTGIYQRMMSVARASSSAIQHGSYVLETGGRIAGIISPKDGTIPDEKFQTLVREVRNVAEAPDAAKRTTIMQGPIDFTPTAVAPKDLQLDELAKMSREDIFAGWGVPPSQAGIPTAAGLNSGETKAYDEAVLMQGAVHDRVISIRESIQYGWLDKYRPLVIELEIEEPTFDDEGPAYELLVKSKDTAMTNEERRALIGLPPTGDEAIDKAIILSSLQTVWATAPVNGQAVGVIEGEEPPAEDEEQPEEKASKKELLGLRSALDSRFVPALRKDVNAALLEQRRAIVSWVRSHGAHLTSKPKDTAWWNSKREEERLRAALDAHYLTIGQTTQKRVKDVMGEGKARDVTIEAVLRREVNKRIVGINDFTREQVAKTISEGIDEGLGAAELGDRIEALGVFGEERAERIARTETMFAYNTAALESYTDFGVDMVEPIDGDQDPECIARLERGPVSIAEALADEDHPNGTLDWVPYFGKATSGMAGLPTEPLPVVPPQPVAAPQLDIPELIASIAQVLNSSRPDPVNVFVSEGKASRTVIDRDLVTGKVIGSHEEPMDDPFRGSVPPVTKRTSYIRDDTGRIVEEIELVGEG
jgi:hypothetical protein